MLPQYALPRCCNVANPCKSRGEGQAATQPDASGKYNFQCFGHLFGHIVMILVLRSFFYVGVGVTL